MEIDYLIVRWSAPDGEEFNIGMLERVLKVYYFWYIGDGVRKAEQKGFRLFPEFPFREMVYLAYELFGTFSSRLPSRSRVDIDKILNRYGLDEYDPFDLLAASGGKLPCDRLSFKRR